MSEKRIAELAQEYWKLYEEAKHGNENQSAEKMFQRYLALKEVLMGNDGISLTSRHIEVLANLVELEILAIDKGYSELDKDELEEIGKVLENQPQ